MTTSVVIPAAPSKKRKRVLPPPAGSAEAKRLAAAILEVLGGFRTTQSAASALGISLPRYYALEARAIAALVRGLEARARGRVRTPEREVEVLKREKERLEREVARSQALVRATQRTVGLSPPEPPKKGPGRKRRLRRPSARALKVLPSLRPPEASGPPATHPQARSG